MLQGTYTALVTPFTQDLAIDWEAFETLVHNQLQNKVDGFVLFGSTGEGSLLNTEEKKELLQRATAIVNKSVPIVASISDNNTKVAEFNAQIALEYGASFGLILPPFYVKATKIEVENHFIDVAKQGLPLILYNNPARTHVSIEIDSLEELCLHKNIVGIKDCSLSVDYCTQVLKKTRLSYFCGDDQFGFSTCMLGGHGLISILSNAYPHEMAQMIHSALNSDVIEAKRIFQRFNPLFHVMGLASNPKPIKYILSRLHLCKMHVKKPLDSLSPIHQRKIDQVLDAQFKSTLSSHR